VKRYLRTQVQRATAAAATVTGKPFGLLVASSLVATSAIVATALSNPSGVSPLAALVGRSLAADHATPAAEPTPEASPEPPAPSPAPSGTSGVSQPPTPSPAPEPTEAAVPSADPQQPTAPTPPAEPTPEAGLIKHVFVVNLVSPGYEAAFGSTSQMPYLSGELRPKGELLSGYSLLDEGSLPNDLAAIAGQRPDPKTKAGCPAFGECVQPLEIPTIADQLTIGRFTWHAYLEGMADPTSGKPDSCVYPAAEDPYPPAEGGYTAARNPFVFFHSLLDLGDCAANDVPLTELEDDLRKAGTTADVVYLTPGLCNAGAISECPVGQAGGPAAADAFLAAWAPKILKSAAFKADGLLIVAFNQLDPAPAADGSVPPASHKVGALMVSRFLSPGATDTKAYDPYSLLRSIEDLFGLSHLAGAGAAKVKPFASTTLLREGTGD
jgi:phosphatidylinositol-3-phosphatase